MNHYTLVGLFQDRSLKEVIYPRLFCLKEKTLQFGFTIEYLSGKWNSVVDALLRFPFLKVTPSKEEIDQWEDIVAVVCIVAAAAHKHDGIVTMEKDGCQITSEWHDILFCFLFLPHQRRQLWGKQKELKKIPIPAALWKKYVRKSEQILFHSMSSLTLLFKAFKS